MITLEKDNCSCCGLCATICHEHCIQMDDGGPIIASEFCSTCTQCIAICPTQALAWNHTKPEPYDRQRLPAPEQLDELFKERRSIRHYFHELPAAFVLIVGRRKIPLSEASAQYALANMMYYAQAKGIGSYLCGNGQLFLDKNRAFRKRLGLGRSENVLGALFLGYPAVKFSNKVTGKRLPIQWNDVRNA
jgi:Fe-S-cluster-containing hydrogenase component 2